MHSHQLRFPGTDVYSEFRQSITPDLYDTESYIDWPEIRKILSGYEQAIHALERIVSSSEIKVQDLGIALSDTPELYSLFCILLAIPNGVGFEDGRELPPPALFPYPSGDFQYLVEPSSDRCEQIAELLVEIGIREFFLAHPDVTSLLRVALAVRDAGRRRYRVRPKIEERLRLLVSNSVQTANNAKVGVFGFFKSTDAQRMLSELTTTRFYDGLPPGPSRMDYLITLDNRPIIAIASVFQTASGGRQQRDLQSELPRLQERLSSMGINLVLIADGRGLRDLRDGVLEALFGQVASVLTFGQAEQGRLADEMIRLSNRQISAKDSNPIETIIESILKEKNVVRARDLPIEPDRARLALATFVSDNQQWALNLVDEGRSIVWRARDSVERLSSMGTSFSPFIVTGVFAELLSPESIQTLDQEGQLLVSKIQLRSDDSVLPDELLIAAAKLAPSADTIRRVAAQALAHTNSSRLSVLLTYRRPDRETMRMLRALQHSLTSNVIVIDVEQLVEMTRGSVDPRIVLKQLVLDQSDLVKVSPFVINNATPKKMFFGRDTEEALLVSRLATNSVALIGGRRIGKTSLMRHVEAKLRAAGFSAYFADCQTVRDWHDFSHMAYRRWNVSVDSEFRPSGLFDIVEQLKHEGTGSKVVFLLDEIDHLLDWDSKHSDTKVPEAFFRACRSLSQEGSTQFVFSGERAISRRMWDAQSPHWNFCQPLMLRQLDKASARSLLINPLKDLQISVRDESAVFELLWHHTNGHPQLIQTLGDRLVRLVSERTEPNRGAINGADLLDVADNYTYAEQYLETYWGQATHVERLLSLLPAEGISTFADIRRFLADKKILLSEDEIRSALRMLELYGIITPQGGGYQLSLDWLVAACEYYGGIESMLEEYMKEVRNE